MMTDMSQCSTIILGCGNVLMGDDGFGPAVIEHLLQHHQLPTGVMAVDIGTSIRNLLFDLLLLPEKPQRMIIVDAVSDSGRPPGTIFELPLREIPSTKVNDFSVHQFPSLNLLQELNDAGGIEVRMVVVQTQCIPDEVRAGLSAVVKAAVPKACAWLIEEMERSS
ncbi:MAG TPA: coenzyme F420 hydrogenase [Syntrophobacteraceae bacterium]|nr:coenzyme F420 hydrogenase [Syntrophobacteraceae bacterium]